MGLRKRPTTVPKDRVYIGKILKPHGLRGEVKFNPFGCDPWLLEEIGSVRVESSDRELEVDYIRGTEKAPIVKFKTVDDRNASEALSGLSVWTHPSKLPLLEESEFYESDILHARVVTVSGEELGQVHSIIETGECDVLVVRSASGDECLLPANKEVVRELRKEENTLVVIPQEYAETDDED